MASSRLPQIKRFLVSFQDGRLNRQLAKGVDIISHLGQLFLTDFKINFAFAIQLFFIQPAVMVHRNAAFFDFNTISFQNRIDQLMDRPFKPDLIFAVKQPYFFARQPPDGRFFIGVFPSLGTHPTMLASLL